MVIIELWPYLYRFDDMTGWKLREDLDMGILQDFSKRTSQQHPHIGQTVYFVNEHTGMLHQGIFQNVIPGTLSGEVEITGTRVARGVKISIELRKLSLKPPKYDVDDRIIYKGQGQYPSTGEKGKVLKIMGYGATDGFGDVVHGNIQNQWWYAVDIDYTNYYTISELELIQDTTEKDRQRFRPGDVVKTYDMVKKEDSTATIINFYKHHMNADYYVIEYEGGRRSVEEDSTFDPIKLAGTSGNRPQPKPVPQSQPIQAPSVPVQAPMSNKPFAERMQDTLRNLQVSPTDKQYKQQYEDLLREQQESEMKALRARRKKKCK